MTPFNWVLLLLMAFGAVTFVARFALGLGGSEPLRHLPVGPVDPLRPGVDRGGRGAFAMAGVIYVFQRKDLYGLGRTAVLMGLLSYSFVMVTLLADLGLPWHSYQLALQAPEHSAMFEVSWCVGLYVTILLLEFLPVPFAHLEPAGRAGAAMERRLRGGGGDAVRLPAVAQPPLRPRDGRDLRHPRLDLPRAGPEGRADHARDRRRHAVDHAPELLARLLPADAEHARPAVVVSRDARLLLPVVDRGRHRARDPHRHVDREGWRRPLEITRLASVGQITFWSLLVYLVFRLGDMAIRNQLSGAFAGTLGMAFAAEILLGGVPLILLARKSLRQRPDVLFVASLRVLGVAFNRMNVVSSR